MTDMDPDNSISSEEVIENPMQQPGQIKRIATHTFSKRGARFGLYWVIFVAIFAVLAPFIANSHPYYMVTEDGTTRFPLFKHLSFVDYTLFQMGLTFVILYFLKHIPIKTRMIVFASITLITLTLSLIFANPPELEYKNYRRGDYRGVKITSIIYAPIAYSPNDNLRDKGDNSLNPPFWKLGKERDEVHEDYNLLLGSTYDGSDVFSGMLHASRIALAIGFVSTSIAMLFGITLGAIMGYFSGKVDMFGMRLVEIFESVPQLVLLLALMAVIDRESPTVIFKMMVVIGLTSWTGYTRFIRAEFFKLRNQDYIQAAKACGLPLKSILFRHMLPNGIAPALVSASFGIAAAILYEATLSFLGLGPIGQPSWGKMLSEAIQPDGFKWWMAIFPGFAIFMTVFAYNLIGESLRDAIDPHSKKQSQL